MLQIVASLVEFARKSRSTLRKADPPICINRSNVKEMRSFITFVLTSIVLPTAIGFTLIEIIGWRNDSTTSVVALAAVQAKDVTVVTVPNGGIPSYGAYKLARIREVQPDVVYIGQSRCGELRSEMFKPYRFYNACLSAWTFDQITEMLDQIFLVSHPSIVIFEIDYFMFTEPYRSAWASKAEMKFVPRHIDDLRILVTELKSKPVELLTGVLFGADHPKYKSADGLRFIGSDAMEHSAGFRYDGSFQYPRGYDGACKLKKQNAAADFLMGIHGASQMDKGQVAALGRLAQAGKKYNAALVGMQLPILKPVIDFLQHDESYRPYAGVWREFESDQTRRLIADLGITFFDMAQSPAAADPCHFVDPAHPNEGGLTKALIDLSNDPAFLRIFPRIEMERLTAEYNSAAREERFFDVYGLRF